MHSSFRAAYVTAPRAQSRQSKTEAMTRLRRFQLHCQRQIWCTAPSRQRAPFAAPSTGTTAFKAWTAQLRPVLKLATKAKMTLLMHSSFRAAYVTAPRAQSRQSKTEAMTRLRRLQLHCQRQVWSTAPSRQRAQFAATSTGTTAFKAWTAQLRPVLELAIKAKMTLVMHSSFRRAWGTAPWARSRQSKMEARTRLRTLQPRYQRQIRSMAPNQQRALSTATSTGTMALKTWTVPFCNKKTVVCGLLQLVWRSFCQAKRPPNTVVVITERRAVQELTLPNMRWRRSDDFHIIRRAQMLPNQKSSLLRTCQRKKSLGSRTQRLKGMTQGKTIPPICIPSLRGREPLARRRPPNTVVVITERRAGQERTLPNMRWRWSDDFHIIRRAQML